MIQSFNHLNLAIKRGRHRLMSMNGKIDSLKRLDLNGLRQRGFFDLNI